MVKSEKNNFTDLKTLNSQFSDQTAAQLYKAFLCFKITPCPDALIKGLKACRDETMVVLACTAVTTCRICAPIKQENVNHVQYVNMQNTKHIKRKSNMKQFCIKIFLSSCVATNDFNPFLHDQQRAQIPSSLSALELILDVILDLLKDISPVSPSDHQGQHGHTCFLPHLVIVIIGGGLWARALCLH